jgi:hypothetical protein
MYRIIILARLFGILMISCKPVIKHKEYDKKLVIEEATNTLNNYYQDISKQGLLAEFKYLDSSKEFFWVPPGYASAINYDSVKHILTQNATAFRSIQNQFETLQIIPLSETLASYTGRIQSTITDTTGKTSVIRLLETGVLIYRKNGWKLYNGQTSMLLQP